MAESTNQQMTVPPDQGWQWAFSYLRQDIQELRAEGREFQAEVRAEFRELRSEMNRRMDRHFAVTISTLVAIGGVLAALIKL